ncbi:hypothetical protein CEXT_94351 [Caerostris extrusa]|uniref:Uncharacterized protein n=1 Tax=Caerostris extrusa TaxID=172846 RepID=A0AAV4Y1L7_CAEEX|nr:hypothetical protein CEXT_94351 [Caerostris extrusa]
MSVIDGVNSMLFQKLVSIIDNFQVCFSTSSPRNPRNVIPQTTHQLEDCLPRSSFVVDWHPKEVLGTIPFLGRSFEGIDFLGKFLRSIAFLCEILGMITF